MKKLEVLITSGGTISKIDDARHIGNFSTGTTGALIAEEFLNRGATVHYVYSKNSKRPFRKDLSVNPEYKLDDEIKRITSAYSDFQKFKSNLIEHPIETFEEYQDTVKSLVSSNTSIDAIILAAAVSDYGVKKTDGKISSDHDELSLALEKYPKVLSLIKTWNPKMYQVGFKLMTRVSFDELVEVAYKTTLHNHSDLTVANVSRSGNFAYREVALISPSGEVNKIALRDLPSKLADAVYAGVFPLN